MSKKVDSSKFEVSNLSFREYQGVAKMFAQFPDAHTFLYPVFGLMNEAGELGGKVKHLWRDKGKKSATLLTDKEKGFLAKELGDVLWYVAACATWFDLNLEDVAKGNLRKLTDRLERDVICGEGDNR